MIKSGLEEWLYANANVRYNEVHEPRSDQITVIVEWTTKKKCITKYFFFNFLSNAWFLLVFTILIHLTNFSKHFEIHILKKFALAAWVFSIDTTFL